MRARGGEVRRALVLTLLVVAVAGGASTACTAPRGAPAQRAGTQSSTSTSPADSRPATSSDAAVLYAAVSVREGGRAVGWLPRSPIRLWFEQLDGERTAIVDAPVNTYSVPTAASGDLLWTGEGSSGTAVGCARGCDADGFAARITSSSATGAWADGLLTITAGRSTAVFAPTAAPIPERSTCDRTSIDRFPCTRLVTVSGTVDGTVVDALRVSPLTATIDGTGDRRVITFFDGRSAVRAPIRLVGGYGSTPAGSARTTGSCSPRAASCRSSRFIETMLRSTVTWRVHFSSILLTSRDRTLQLEAR